MSKYSRELQAYGQTLGLVSRLEAGSKHNKLYFSKFRGGPERFVTIHRANEPSGSIREDNRSNIRKIAEELPDKPKAQPATQSTIEVKPMTQSVQLTAQPQPDHGQPKTFLLKLGVDARGSLRVVFGHKLHEAIFSTRKARLVLNEHDNLIIELSSVVGHEPMLTRGKDHMWKFKEGPWDWGKHKIPWKAFGELEFDLRQGKLVSLLPLPDALLKPQAPALGGHELIREALTILNNWLMGNSQAKVSIEQVPKGHLGTAPQIRIKARVVTEVEL